MDRLIKIIKHQGTQYIRDVNNVELPVKYKGRTGFENIPCPDKCSLCRECCPTSAIAIDPLAVDTGKCVYCHECENSCPEKKIVFTGDFRTASNVRENLMLTESNFSSDLFDPDKIRSEIKLVFGRSLKLRLVSAGSCNGCELELNACGNVNFDMGRYGIEFLASPRHCDGVVLTGPMVVNSESAFQLTMESVPSPKILVAFGACAISGGIFAHGGAVSEKRTGNILPDLFVPGCPPHPLTFINGILRLIGK